MPSYLPIDYFSSSRRGAMIPAGPSGDYRDRLTPGFTTPDLQSIQANTRRSKLAHDFLTRASLDQANQDNALLEAALRSGSAANLFNQPTTDDEARLQQIVQNDYNAKERGISLIPTWQTLLKKRQLEETLADDEQRRLLAQKQYEQSLRNEDLKRQELGLSKEQFANLKQHQNIEDVFKRDQFNAQVQNERDKLARDSENQRRADERIVLQNFPSIQRAVQSGQLSADDAIASMPGLSESQASVLRAYESAARAEADQAQKQADRYNSDIQARTQPIVIDAKPGYFGTRFGATPATTMPRSPADIASAQQGVIQSFQRDPIARKQIYFDEQSGRFQPQVRFNERPAPTMTDPVLPPWRYGSTYTGTMPDISSGPFPDDTGFDSSSPAALTFNNRGFASPAPAAPVAPPTGLMEGPDGYLYRMVNGVPQRTNLRRTVR